MVLLFMDLCYPHNCMIAELSELEYYPKGFIEPNSVMSLTTCRDICIHIYELLLLEK